MIWIVENGAPLFIGSMGAVAKYLFAQAENYDWEKRYIALFVAGICPLPFCNRAQKSRQGGARLQESNTIC